MSPAVVPFVDDPPPEDAPAPAAAVISVVVEVEVPSATGTTDDDDKGDAAAAAEPAEVVLLVFVGDDDGSFRFLAAGGSTELSKTSAPDIGQSKHTQASHSCVRISQHTLTRSHLLKLSRSPSLSI